ncbi:hypothetical protein ACS0TY_030042 [Phlomoides rotata]
MHVFLTLSAPSRLYLSDLCLSAAPPVAAHRSPPAAAVQQPPWAASGSCVTSLDVQKHLSPSPTYSHRSFGFEGTGAAVGMTRSFPLN